MVCFTYSDMVRLPGDKEFCRKFRKEEKMYRKDRWFLDLVDIAVFDYLMSHHDSKHTMIYKRENDKPEFNVLHHLETHIVVIAADNF